MRFNVQQNTLLPVAELSAARHRSNRPAERANAPRPPRYIALSYTWDPMLPLHELLINETMLNVGDMLWQAILELTRRPMLDAVKPPDTWWWIDQIRIDQAEGQMTVERQGQLNLMGDIYEQCSLVVVWLGPATHDSPLAIQLFNDLARLTLTIGYSELEAFVARTPMAVWTAVNTFFAERLWFTRAWIFQE